MNLHTFNWFAGHPTDKAGNFRLYRLPSRGDHNHRSDDFVRGVVKGIPAHNHVGMT